MLDKKFYTKLGANVRDKYRKHIFAKARDVYSRAFKGYTTEYGQRKKANKFKRQHGRSLNTKAPILTGDLLNDFGSHFVVKNNGVEIGWASQGAKVEWLKKLGRVLTTSNQPLPKGIIQYIQTQGHSYIKKKLGPNKTTRHRIGK